MKANICNLLLLILSIFLHHLDQCSAYSEYLRWYLNYRNNSQFQLDVETGAYPGIFGGGGGGDGDGDGGGGGGGGGGGEGGVHQWSR